MAAAQASIIKPIKRLKRVIVGFLDNLSIRAKLFLYAGFLIALMVLLAGAVLYQVSEVSNRHIPARAAARDMEAALLTMQVQELSFINETDSLNSEFYLKQNSVSLNTWQENYRIFETNYRTLTKLFPQGEVKRELDVIEPFMARYRDTFLALTGAYRERGFQSFGREGVLRTRAESLETNLASSNASLVAFLRLQGAQERFLLYREAATISTFHDYAAQLRPLLVKAEDRNLFDEYVRLFDEVVAIYKRIGLNNVDGLRGQLSQLMKETTPHIQAAEATVLLRTSDSISSIARSILITTVLLAAVAILMAIVLSRLIIKRIDLLSEGSRRIAAGNFNYQLPVHATDELGQLTQSFNTMVEQLHHGRQTLRERAHALSDSVKRFELINHVVNEAIYEWDIKSGKLTWGEGIVSVFGYQPADKTTMIDWWTERIHPEDVDAIDSSLAERLHRHSNTWKKEYRFKKANGEYVYCQDRGIIEYHNGKPIRMIGSVIDVSHQKALDRAKDEFISIASHQLRTPLGSIRWNLELLLEKVKSLPPNLAEYAQDAYTSTLRMAGLVNDLLSVARIDQDRVKNIPENTDLVAIIKAAVGEMVPIAKVNRVRIDSTQLRNTRAEVLLDPKRFREVIQNLLSNAVKYTPPKGKVVVAIENHSKDYTISIADDGIGIPLEDQPKLFTKFYRATNVTTTDTEGSGLGLFVVRSYVEAWGGRVWFVSHPNQGTTFYVSIPHKPRVLKERT